MSEEGLQSVEGTTNGDMTPLRGSLDQTYVMTA